MRITKKDLECVVDRINRMKNLPLTPYTRTKDGKFHANAGVYNLQLNRMSTIEGCTGEEVVISGFGTKRELYDKMQAFINGMESV